MNSGTDWTAWHANGLTDRQTHGKTSLSRAEDIWNPHEMSRKHVGSMGEKKISPHLVTKSFPLFSLTFGFACFTTLKTTASLSSMYGKIRSNHRSQQFRHCWKRLRCSQTCSNMRRKREREKQWLMIRASCRNILQKEKKNPDTFWQMYSALFLAGIIRWRAWLDQ